MPRKTKAEIKDALFKPKYSKKIQEFICDKIEDGMTLAAVCKTYGPPKGDLIPNEKTMYRWQAKYPEFKLAVRDAYKTFLLRLIDEKMDLASRAMELTEIINKSASDDLAEDIRRAKFELDAIKVKLRSLEFTLTRIAPLFVPDLKPQEKDNKLDAPQIVIKQYLIGSEVNDKKDEETSAQPTVQ